MALPALKAPTLFNSKEGIRELVWILPEKYAKRAADILVHEAKIDVKINEIDLEESFLSAKYPEHKAPFVTFSILVFRSFYEKCLKAEAMMEASKVKIYDE